MAKTKEYKSAETIESDEDTSGFSAPSGYSQVKFGKALGSGFKDKQVWVIQLPASLDIKQLSSIPVDSKSKSFTVNGRSFSLAEDSKIVLNNNTSLTKLLTGSSSGELSVSSKDISRSFKIVEKVVVPDVDYDGVRTPKPVVPQKTGLHMRYAPTGYGVLSYIGNEPSESTAAFQQKLLVSKKSKEPKGPKKDLESSSPSKSPKKDKKRPSEEEADRKKKKHKKSKHKDA